MGDIASANIDQRQNEGGQCESRETKRCGIGELAAGRAARLSDHVTTNSWR